VRLLPEEYCNQIIAGDARALTKRIPDESIDLIFCDPVYNQIDDYRWLAEVGSRILVDGGNLIAQTGQHYLPQVLAAMDGQLDYVWVIAKHIWGRNAQMFSKRIIVAWKPFVWFSKGKRNGDWIFDWIRSGNMDKTVHKWGDPPEMIVGLVERLTDEQGVVFDPFTGGGTVPVVCKRLGRNYVAFDIDEETAQVAQRRVENTQMPLPLSVPIQKVLV